MDLVGELCELSPERKSRKPEAKLAMKYKKLAKCSTLFCVLAGVAVLGYQRTELLDGRRFVRVFRHSFFRLTMYETSRPFELTPYAVDCDLREEQFVVDSPTVLRSASVWGTDYPYRGGAIFHHLKTLVSNYELVPQTVAKELVCEYRKRLLAGSSWSRLRSVVEKMQLAAVDVARARQRSSHDDLDETLPNAATAKVHRNK